MKKPLSVSSPTHAIALSVYFMLGWAGFLGVFNLSAESATIQAMGPVLEDVWATTLMIGGWGALSAAVAAKKARRPEYNLRTEKIFCLALFINLTYFTYVALSSFGARGFSIAVFAMTFALGTFARAVQLFFERRLIARARANPEQADPVMADPRDESDR
jgi:hypothetical protein